MKFLARSIVIAVAVTATLSAAPAQASVDQIRDGELNIRCEGTRTAQKCNLRVASGFKRLEVRYIHGGQVWAKEGWHTYERRTRGPLVAGGGRVNSSVRVDCRSYGNRINCDVFLRGYVDEFAFTAFTAGENWGGLRASGISVSD